MAGLALVTGLAFGIAPALSASQIDLNQTIRGGGQRSARSFWVQFRGWLIAAEVALTVVLLVAAGLLTRSMRALVDTNPGFNAEHVLTVRIAPNQSFCNDRGRCIALYDDLLRRARGIPEVADVAVANTVPLDGELAQIPVDVENHTKTADFLPMLWAGAISADYVKLMCIHLLAGRGFTESDAANSAPVVLISASTARRFWPGESAVGKHMKPTWDDRWRTIVGVVADVGSTI